MERTDSGRPEEISFFHELLRKATHMGALVIPGGYYFFGLSKSQLLTIMIPIALLMVLIDVSRLRRWGMWMHFFKKWATPIIRPHELDGDFTGATYILITVCATVALFSKPIAIAALVFIIVGDSFAAVVGRRYGRHRLIGRKTVEGSLGCLFGTVIVALVVPDLSLAVGLTGAVAATVVEAAPLGIDDNVTVPLLSGLIMTLLSKILAFL